MLQDLGQQDPQWYPSGYPAHMELEEDNPPTGMSEGGQQHLLLLLLPLERG